TWARAGHPPMVLASADGVGSLWQPSGLILGVYPDAEYVPASQQLRAGDLLLLYTDGYVEDPEGDIDDGLRTLCDHAHSALGWSLPDRPAALVDRLRSRNPCDDACLLVAETLP